MRTNIIFIYFTVGLVIHSCKKDQTTDSSGQIAYPSITGYTGTDVVGNIIGPVDSTDWRTNDSWSQAEKNVFGGTNFNINCLFSDTLLAAGYPNPTTTH